MVSRESGVMVTPFQKTLWFGVFHFLFFCLCFLLSPNHFRPCQVSPETPQSSRGRRGWGLSLGMVA